MPPVGSNVEDRILGQVLPEVGQLEVAVPPVLPQLCLLLVLQLLRLQQVFLEQHLKG